MWGWDTGIPEVARPGLWRSFPAVVVINSTISGQLSCIEADSEPALCSSNRITTPRGEGGLSLVFLDLRQLRR